LDVGTASAAITAQELWATGVTYFRSRDARMEESKAAGGGTFYDRVYSADRPELFFKSDGWRVIGPGGMVRIRADATWSVPEPELTLLVSASGKVTGYTIGNDMSSRDIGLQRKLRAGASHSVEGAGHWPVGQHDQDCDRN
jgi:2-dehydro-3-deoxy-D-arabinonate dehydratase